MSSIALQGNASGAGVFTVAAPNSASSYTLTLPTATGTLISTGGGNAISGTTGTFTGDMAFNSGYGSAATAYGCRAWVTYNGSSPGSIRASGGVSSVTYNSAGKYTVNFSFTFVDANYCVTGAQQANAGSGQMGIAIGSTNPTTTSCQIWTANIGSGYLDTPYMCAAFFR